MNSKKIWFFAIYISYVLLPIVSAHVSSVIRVALAVIVLISIGSFAKGIKQLVPLFAISILTDALQVSETGRMESLSTMGYSYLHLFTAALLGLYVLCQCNINDKLHRFCRIILIFLIVTNITTIVGNIIFPGASRILAGIGDQKDLFNQYMNFNIGGFDFVYMMVIIFPLAICMIRCLPKKFISYALFISIIGMILETGYGIATMFAMLSLLLFIGKTELRIEYLRKLMIFTVVFFLLMQSILPSLLDFVATIIPSEEVATRFHDLAISLSGKEVEDSSDLTSRSDQYMISINNFFQTSMIGTFTHESGGHSLFLDTLSRFGLFGLCLFILLLKKTYVLFVKPFKYESFYGYLFFSYFLYCLCVIVNPQPYLFCITFLYPVFTTYLKKEFLCLK